MPRENSGVPGSMPEYSASLIQQYDHLHKRFQDNIDQSNKIWYGLIRLLITLASSLLFLSAAFIDKIIVGSSRVETSTLLEYHLYASWFLFMMVILLGIFAEIEGARFHDQGAKATGRLLVKKLAKIVAGETCETLKLNMDDNFVISSNLVWGKLQIISFIIASCSTFIYCIGSLKSLPTSLVFTMWIFVFIVIGFALWYFRDKDSDRANPST